MFVSIVLTDAQDLSPRHVYGTVAVTWHYKHKVYYTTVCEMDHGEYSELLGRKYEGEYYIHSSYGGVIRSNVHHERVRMIDLSNDPRGPPLRKYLLLFDGDMKDLLCTAICRESEKPAIFIETILVPHERCDASVLFMSKSVWAAPAVHSKLVVQYPTSSVTYAVWRQTVSRATIRKELAAGHFYACYIGYDNKITSHNGRIHGKAYVSEGDMLHAMIAISNEETKISVVGTPYITLDGIHIPTPEHVKYKRCPEAIITVAGNCDTDVDKTAALTAENKALKDKLALVEKGLREASIV